MGGHSQNATLAVDGTPLPEDLATRLVELYVDDHLSLPDTFMARFTDADHDLAAKLGVRIGSEVTVRTGALGERADATLIVGEVTALEATFDIEGSHLVVRGYDHSHRLHRARRTKTFQDVTDADLVTRIARAAGVKVGTVTPTNVVHRHVTQLNMTDWEFLRARAREIGFELLVADAKVQFRPPARQGPPVELEQDRTLLEFRPRITAAQQVGKVEVRGWDYVAKREVTATTETSTVSVALEDPALAPARLAATFGDATYVSCDRVIASAAEARAAAAAVAEEIGSAFAEAEGIAVGDPKLTSGAKVKISGVSDSFEGVWTLSRTRHHFTHDGGYLTSFEVAGRQDRSLLGLASLGASAGGVSAGGPPIYGAVVGVVSATKDPDRLGRVKLRFPWLAPDYESDWVRLCHAGAGANHGLFVMPEMEAEVLVVFEHGDIRRPYVLGGLYNGVDKPAGAYYDDADGSIDRRSLTSKKGHFVALSDKDGQERITLDVGGDFVIELDQDARRITVRSKGEVVIEAEQDLKIKGRNVSVEAQMALTLKGQTAKLEGSTTEIKGQPIRLN